MELSRPRILMTTSSSIRERGFRRIDSLTGKNYSEAVLLAGGLPLMVSNLDAPFAEACLEGMAGLLLTGGGDLHPSLFGEDPHPQLDFVDLQRDYFELALYRAAKARRLPVLGICRGIQVMAVGEGGSLHQHLPDLPGIIQHDAANPDGSPLHDVSLEPGSRLSQLFGATSVRTNSYHHQAVDAAGRDLQVTARSSDGVVEAVEGYSEDFVVGVQWHPEMNYRDDPAQMALFRAFVEAAERTIYVNVA